MKVGIFTGGKSEEHEVSLLSGLNILKAIDKTKFEPVILGVQKNGEIHYYSHENYLNNPTDPKNISLKIGEPVTLLPQPGGKIYSLIENKVILKLECAFSVLHGKYGEDGNMQGLFNLAEIPFVGSNVLASAVGMDKEFTKRILRDSNIPIAEFITVHEKSHIPTYQEVSKKLGKILFVKPANEGSSVGVSKVKNEAGFHEAIAEAFKYDKKILIEEYIKGRELECAVLEENSLIASCIGEIIPNHEFYSYEAKYIDNNGAKCVAPAEIPEKIALDIQKLSMKAFRALGCEGLSRVDFFLKENNELVINEINTLPGFTSISMYPQLLEKSGINYQELITKLIEKSLKRKH